MKSNRANTINASESAWDLACRSAAGDITLLELKSGPALTGDQNYADLTVKTAAGKTLIIELKG